MSDVVKTVGNGVSGVGQGVKTYFGGNALNVAQSAWNDLSGTSNAANAAQSAADAQAQAAKEQRDIIVSTAKQNQTDIMNLAQSTPQELAVLGTSYDKANQALTRDENLMAAIDPSIMEASKQALNILKGGQADVNKPLTDMRNTQRNQLVNSLRSQYGPGAESSSVGQKALNQFDMQTNSMYQTNQQNTLGQLFGMANTDLGGRTQRDLSGLQQVGQGYSALQNRQLNARTNAGNATLGALSGTSQQMIQAAGAPYVGQAIQAQGNQQMFNTGLQLFSAYAGNYAGAMGKQQGATAGGAVPVPANSSGYGPYNPYQS